MAHDFHDDLSRPTHHALALLGGLGVGALLMFLADPASGRRRRARLHDRYVHVSRKVQRGRDLVIRDASNRAHGAGLTVAGWIRGAGLALGALGGGLLARAATSRGLKGLAGTGEADRGIVVQKSIHIDAPREEVYRHWTIENFPRWMRHVKRVTPIGPDRHRWVVEGPAGAPVEWESEITRAVENRELEWRADPGSAVDNAGRVRFTDEDGGTRVQVTLCYLPPGGVLGHAVAKALGADPRSRMDDDLMRFKALLETGHPARDAAARRGAGMHPGSEARH